MINYLNYKDSIKRLKYVKQEAFSVCLKSCLQDTRIGFKGRFVLKNKLQGRTLRLCAFGISKIRNRCKETGRNRFVLSLLGLSRAQFKRKAAFRHLSGLKKI